MSAENTDRNLLFGVLALQADFLDAAQFAEVCSAWAGRKDTPLADLLVERCLLTAEQRGLVDNLLQHKLNKHGGDACASLAAVTTPDVRSVLESVADKDVQQSLSGLPTPANPIQHATAAYEPDARQRYTLTRLHARGGIGQVWLAHDEDLGRDVALKELRPDRGDSPDATARFLEEAKVTGQLEHPGIVPVYELVQPRNGQPCYAMRFVGGRTLADAIRDYHRKRQEGEVGPLDLRQLLTAFVAVCNAVAYAHSRGVLHRDLKPQNVALGDFGEALVLDWGLAKVVGQPEGPTSLLPVSVGQADSRDQTRQGQVLGTPAYMAPEQAEGRLDLMDQRSDVYSLGAVLYEVLTGQSPFGGADVQEVLKRVVQEAPVLPRQRVAATPAALQAVCLKALAKERGERYGSARELAREVERFLADEPVTAFREPWRVRLGRWARHHRPLVAAVLALLVTATVALAVSTALVRRQELAALEAKEQAERERDRADDNFRLAKEAGEQSERSAARALDSEAREKEARALAVRRQYVSDMRLVQTKFDTGDFDEADRLLARHVPVPGAEDLRGFEWHFYRRRVGERRSPPGRFFPAPVDPNGIAVSPDGRSLAVSGRDGTVRILNVADGKEAARLELPGDAKKQPGDEPQWLAFSHRGDSIVTVARGRLVVFDVRARKGTQLSPPVFESGPAVFSPDGKLVAAIADRDGGGVVCEVATGKVRRRWKSQVEAIQYEKNMPLALQFSPDGRALAEARSDGLALWSVDGEAAPRILRGHTRPPEAFQFLADGTYLISASTAEVVVFHVASASVVRKLTYSLPADQSVGRRSALHFAGGVTERGHHLTLSPEGGYVVLLLGNGQLWTMDTVTGQTAQSRWLRPPVGDATPRASGGLRVAAGPYGSPLVKIGPGREVGVWSLRDLEPEFESLPIGPFAQANASFSPDGKLLALTGSDAGGHTMNLWDARTSQVVAALRPPDKPTAGGHLFSSVEYSPDGKLLALTGSAINVPRQEMAPFRNRLTVVDARTLEATWRHDYDEAETCMAPPVAFSPDGKRLAFTGGLPGPRVFDAATGKAVAELPVPNGVVACFGHDGTALLLQGLGGMDLEGRGEVIEWGVESRKPLRRFEGACGLLIGLAVSLPLDLVAGGDVKGWLYVWQYSTGKLRHRLRVGEGAGIYRVAFTPDGKRLAVGDIRRFTLWDPVLGEEILTAPTTRNFFFAIAPDGLRILAGFTEGSVRQELPGMMFRAALWDARPLTPTLRTEREARLAIRYLERTVGVKDEILIHLKGDRALSDAARDLVGEIARRYADQPALLFALARTSVYDPSRPKGEQTLAKHQLVAAIRSHPVPKPVGYLEAMAAAHYRLGELKEAREALQTAEGVMKAGFSPASLALLAMAHKRLKDGEKAATYLARARKAAPAPLPDIELAPGLKLRALLEEAERVVGGGD